MAMDFVTDVGRLVSGSVSVASDKGYNGAVREKPQYFFAVAIPKTQPNINKLLSDIQQNAWTSYQGVQGGQGVLQRMQHGPIGSVFPQGMQAPFAWKVEDGDAPEHATKEGWQRAWVLKFAGTFPVHCANAQNQQLNPVTVQLGSWVQVAGSTDINGKTDHTAGIYLNYRIVRVIDSGTLIVPGPNAAQIFGDVVPPLPAGVTPTGGAVLPPPPAGYGAPQQPGNYTPGPAPAPHVAPQQPGATPQYLQPSASYPPAAGQPGTHMQPAGGATPAYPSSAPGNPPVAYAPGVPAGAVPAPAAPGAPGMPQPGYQATAYPSNAPGAYPGVQPHPGFVSGQ